MEQAEVVHPPGDHEYVYPGTPPVAEEVTLPSQTPKQETSDLVILGDRLEGAFIETVLVAVQFWASVRVILYVPWHSPAIVEVVIPLDHK